VQIESTPRSLATVTLATLREAVLALAMFGVCFLIADAALLVIPFVIVLFLSTTTGIVGVGLLSTMAIAHVILAIPVTLVGAAAATLTLLRSRWDAPGRLLELMVSAAARLRPELSRLTIGATLSRDEAGAIREGLRAGLYEGATRAGLGLLHLPLLWLGSLLTRATLSVLEARSVADGAIEFPSLARLAGRKIERVAVGTLWRLFLLGFLLLTMVDALILGGFWFASVPASRP
jgi:hypothetical protein